MTEPTISEGYAVQPIRDVDDLVNTTTNVNSAATTNATSLKATPGRLLSVNIHNYNAAARTLKFYDKASAPTVGTDVPVLQFTIAAAGDVQATWPNGLKFNLGIAYAMTTEATVAGTTAVGAVDLVGKIAWT